MTAKQLNPVAGKHRCDRCGGHAETITECVFTFKHPRAYWKGVYEAALGKRMTLRRRRVLDEQVFDFRRPPSFWMDLCPPCWAACAAPCDVFPAEFAATVLHGSAALAK